MVVSSFLLFSIHSSSVLSANYVELTIARALRGKSLPRPLNLPEDGLTVGLPPIRLGLKITLSQVFFDISNQLANTGEASLPDNILRYLAKESFHQVHPRRTGRSEMQVETRTSTQPSLHLLMFVCAVVVQDQVDIEFLRCLTVYLLEKAEPFNVRMMFLRTREMILPSR